MRLKQASNERLLPSTQSGRRKAPTRAMRVRHEKEGRTLAADMWQLMSHPGSMTCPHSGPRDAGVICRGGQQKLGRRLRIGQGEDADLGYAK